MASKYTDAILKIVFKDRIKSTNEILRELEDVTGKKINWYVVHRVLFDLYMEKKVEKLDTKSGFFWRRK